MTFRTVAKIVIGVLYALGTIHQGLVVMRSSEDFYMTMADRAWIEPAEAFVESFLIPNSLTVTILVVVFQGLLAVAILSRGPFMAPALVAGGVFSLIGAFTGNPAETIGYLGLAGIHFWLATARSESQHRRHRWRPTASDLTYDGERDPSTGARLRGQ